MRSLSGKLARHCTVLWALGACATMPDDIEDLDAIDDGKSDTALPRTAELAIPAGETKRFRITTRAFVASVTQDGDEVAAITAKHFDLAFASAEAIAPVLEVPGDGTVRNWTLAIANRGDDTLTGTLLVDAPRAPSGELGIISDIDKTVMPPALASGQLVPPYPGITTLLVTLEGAIAGDVTYVTARTPEGVAEVPDWMALHGVPSGTIETGISGVPFIAQKEKVADITRVFEARAPQKFVLFGDSSHRDPEVYKEILAKFPDQVVAGFIHKVNATVSPDRVVGLHLVENYAQAAAQLFGLEVLTEAEARAVIDAARDEGLAITDAEEDALIDAAR